jgi:cytidylate kinase
MLEDCYYSFLFMREMHRVSPFPIITIDGPSGVGKGTMATMLAKTLGWHFLDSGAIYRLLALKTLGAGFVSAHVDPLQLADIARHLNIFFKEGRTYLDNEDVTEAIRREDIGLMASKTSAFSEVRQALLERQRAFAQAPGLVTDGRDMGSVVFPQALLKYYLDADPEVRARRRELQLKERGISVKFSDLLEDIKQRDQQDKSRAVSPLVVPEGAIVIDTGSLHREQVFDKILQTVRDRMTDGGI